MRFEASQKFSRIGIVFRMHLEPRIDERPNQPRPHRALMIRSVARAEIAEIFRLVIRVIAAQDKVPISKYAKQLVDKLAGEAGAPADFAANYAANVLSKEENVSALTNCSARSVSVTSTSAPAWQSLLTRSATL